MKLRFKFPELTPEAEAAHKAMNQSIEEMRYKCWRAWFEGFDAVPVTSDGRVLGHYLVRGRDGTFAPRWTPEGEPLEVFR